MDKEKFHRMRALLINFINSYFKIYAIAWKKIIDVSANPELSDEIKFCLITPFFTTELDINFYEKKVDEERQKGDNLLLIMNLAIKTIKLGPVLDVMKRKQEFSELFEYFGFTVIEE